MSGIFMRYPKGLGKAFTMSYDDGVEQDERLISIMQAHGLRGTFNLSGGRWSPEGTVFPEGRIHRILDLTRAKALYAADGIEVAAHGFTHPFLEQLPEGLAAYEVAADRAALEAQFGCIVRGMAYPYGTYNDKVVATLAACGINYSRTTRTTESFNLPKTLEAWRVLDPTCHHKNPRLFELGRKYIDKKVANGPTMFYLWGHSYEFESDQNWSVIEEFAELISGKDDIWYATNGEIFDYCRAYSMLEFSLDWKIAHNPTATELWLSVDNQAPISIAPGATVRL